MKLLHKNPLLPDVYPHNIPKICVQEDRYHNTINPGKYQADRCFPTHLSFTILRFLRGWLVLVSWSTALVAKPTALASAFSWRFLLLFLRLWLAVGLFGCSLFAAVGFWLLLLLLCARFFYLLSLLFVRFRLRRSLSRLVRRTRFVFIPTTSLFILLRDLASLVECVSRK